MATYTMICENCGHEFSHKQPMTQDSCPPCPKCSGPTRKKINKMSFILRGSGFYSRDNREAADE